MKKTYPYGHGVEEEQRLDQQPELFSEPSLIPLVEQARNCLEIGCGVGSFYRKLRGINLRMKYSGIDVSTEAIRKFETKYPRGEFTKVAVMDAARLQFPDDSFDLAVSHLMLWALGDDAGNAVREVHRTLRDGGHFYSFEPDDGALLFYPEKPALKELISTVDLKMVEKRLNPFVGRSVTALMRTAGFRDVKTTVYSKLSVGSDPATYRATTSNLRGIYLGLEPDFMGSAAPTELLNKVEAELARCEDDDLILESYFVTIGMK